MNQETMLIAGYLSATDDEQSRELVERYAQARHPSIGRAEDMLDAFLHLMGFRREAVSKGETMTPLRHAA